MSFAARTAARFRDLPVRRKLRITLILTTATALLLAGFGIVAADSFLFYRSLRRDLATFAQIIGDNSTGALAFDDAAAATQTLAALHARSHIEIACLYQTSGVLLATYIRPGYSAPCPPPVPREQMRLEQGALAAFHPIRLAGQPLGVLALRYDLREILERIELYGAVVLGALLLSWAIAIALSSKLRALFTQPILELADIARAVSQRRDYTIRARKHSRDEIGVLAGALNEMMEGIQSRDTELRKALEDQRGALRLLAQANTDLKRSNSDLERFAFMASHDLQEPLRMITSYSQLLVAEYFPNANGRAAEYVEYVVGGIKRMRTLLADLLAYSEVAGSAEQPLEVVDLNLVLERVQQMLGIAIEEAEARIIVDPLPVVRAHESRLASLFQNLISNAIKYRGRRPPQIHVSFREEPGEFLFSVADNGIGIEQEYREKIFVAFRRLHGKDVPGTGVGLAICQRVVERYGGRIWVESELGVGSTFRFTLPKSMADQVRV